LGELCGTLLEALAQARVRVAGEAVDLGLEPLHGARRSGAVVLVDRPADLVEGLLEAAGTSGGEQVRVAPAAAPDEPCAARAQAQGEQERHRAPHAH
jgi:hypothetical protein